jgi:hypothetical protein
VASIGTFGTPRPQIEGLDFGYFGLTVRVHPDASEAVVFRFMAVAGGLDLDSPQAAPALADFMTGLIHPDDWAAFMDKAVANRQGTEDLMEVIGGILTALGERPTQQSSDSSAGLSPTGSTSTAEQSSLDIQHQYEQEGRPDLALVVQDVRQRPAI